MHGDDRGVAGGRTQKGYAELNNLPVYKAHRIHTSQLLRGPWLSMIVSIGKRMPLLKDSLTDTVIRVPGEYPTEAEALQAAAHYIDHLEGSESP